MNSMAMPVTSPAVGLSTAVFPLSKQLCMRLSRMFTGGQPTMQSINYARACSGTGATRKGIGASGCPQAVPSQTGSPLDFHMLCVSCDCYFHSILLLICCCSQGGHTNLLQRSSKAQDQLASPAGAVQHVCCSRNHDQNTADFAL